MIVTVSVYCVGVTGRAKTIIVIVSVVSVGDTGRLLAVS